ncbi:WxL domain-containing protein [Bacillus cereus group sp. MYBK79-1]|uniref:WxL domain-containing protein n=1 Tax=unclassified Bacillus cereus group TaxID=2750818 RepID=UPI003F796309
MKLAKLALIGAVTLSTVSVGTSAFAAEKDGGKLDSKAFIKFEKNTDEVNVVNPENPDEVVEPIDPNTKGTNGPLSIDYVSNFNFAMKKASGNNETYYAELDKVKKKADGSVIDVPNYVQVTDNRGTNAGWHLTVKQNGQFKTADDKALDGAALTLKNSTLKSAAGSDAPTAAQSITLNPNGDASDLIDAKVDQGMGTWVNAFGKDAVEAKKSVELSVPGKTKKEQAEYTTSLTWELTDAPM